jgi:RNA polymerase sigma-70 factor (sigma-E family)
VADQEFDEFVRARSMALLRTAVLLTGGDRGHAEDLLQDVLERMYARWPRIEGPEAYARRALVHASVNRWRARRRRPEVPFAAPDAGASPGDAAATVDLRDALGRELLRLPPRQRAVLVLRYFDGLPDPEIADALGCAVGSVRSHASRGLARLRERVALPDLTTPGGIR